MALETMSTLWMPLAMMFWQVSRHKKKCSILGLNFCFVAGAAADGEDADDVVEAGR